MQRLLFTVVVDSLADRHQQFLAGLRAGLAAGDADLLVTVSHPLYPRRGKLLRELASSGRVAGAVLTRMQAPDSGENRAAGMVGDLATVPLLTYDFQVPDVGHVGRPRSAALAAGLRHLAELGRTRLAVLSDLDLTASATRIAALAGGPRPLVLTAARGPGAVTEAVAPLLVRRDDHSWTCDGLVATDDDLALAAVGVLRDQGLRVPDDVAVIGAGDTDAGARHEPPLSSVDESLHALGEQTAHLLLRQARTPTLQPGSVRTADDVQVRVRDSTAGSLAAPLELARRVLGRERAIADRADLEATRQLLDLVQALSDAREPQALFDALSDYLPRIGVRSCFLVRASRSGDGLPMVELAFSHRRGRTDPADPHPAPYPARRLVPDHLDDELSRGSWVMQPLFLDESWLGFLLTDQTRMDHRVTETLRHGISRALADIERARRLAQRAQELEIAVEARTAELRYEAATRRAAQEALSAANMQLREAMLVDSLTMLQNRASLDSQAALMWDQHTADGTPLSVLMIDVDHFKAYNDRYGHAAGDECLRSIAGCLGEVARRFGDFVARYGGEEFVVLMPNTAAEGAAVVADELIAVVRGAGLVHGGGINGRVSVSIGSATSSTTAPRASLNALFTASDRALYRAKEDGRDRRHVAHDETVRPPADQLLA